MKKITPLIFFVALASLALHGAEQIARPPAGTVAAGLLNPFAVSQFANQTQARGQSAMELVVVVNKNNPVENLTIDEVRKYLLGNTQQWPDKRKVTLVVRETESEVFRAMAREVLRMTPSEYRRHVLQVEFQGGEPIRSKSLLTSQSICDFVFNVPNAMGIVEASVAAESNQVKILRIQKLNTFSSNNLQ